MKGAPKVFSLPPSSAFLDELARGLVEATDARKHPEQLADALIFVPNRRAARELALSLHRAVDTTLLTPDIRALGDVDEEDSFAAFGPEALELRPTLSPGARRGALAKLIQAWRTAQDEAPLPPSSLLSAADELAALIDQAALAGDIDWKKLKSLSSEMAPQLAEHWQVSAAFLDIVMKAWPDYLEENQAADVQGRRLEAAKALKARWAGSPPARTVVIAGSTGAGAATRLLMQAALQLPRGLIVFPGIDMDMTEKAWKSVSDAASHPQHVLGHTLTTLGLSRGHVRPWPGVEAFPGADERRKLINEALAPAIETRDWTTRLEELAAPDPARKLAEEALAGVCVVEAEDESEEALAAALLLRETLETPGKTAALVTPEASLARRVAAILERWGIDLAPSAGTALHRAGTGSFLLLLSRWAFDPADPVQLLAVLKHPLCGLRPANELHALASRLELGMLRGPRIARTLEELVRRLETRDTPLPDCANLIQQLDTLHYAVRGAFAGEVIDGAAAAKATARLAETIAATPELDGQHIWAGKTGETAARFIDELAQLCEAMGPVGRAAFPDLVESLMSRATVAPDAPEHPRIVIWGPLEARLQRRDRMILASLNEGSWPKPGAADAFLNRRMRRELGLPDPDERVGLSAHDFAQMANAPEVILLRARRVDDKPAVASRWLWRLRTLAAGGLGRDGAEAALKPPANADPLAWARALRHADKVTPAKPPAPRPPVAARDLGSFSPSRATTLIRDPYADYARRILKLEKLRRVGEDVDARERGTAVHAAVETFEKRENEKALDDLIVKELKEAGSPPELVELEKPLWLRAGQAYLRWSAQRAHHRVAFETEKTARITFETSAGKVELRATADRIEKLADGSLAIIDFKTGQPKTAAQVERGLEPQLALEAVIARRAAFGAIGPADTSELIYFRMSLSAETTKESNGQPLEFETGTTMEIAEAALDGLKGLIEQYANPDQPYYSKPRVEFAWSVSDYDNLARRSEWTTDEGGEE
ncbi:MAG TPA: double-strand break repair protein AddB [Hyphomonadaceae bacterium]|nr:double-strand break repair protein AddB [Hyphomonadaceae bacterium]